MSPTMSPTTAATTALLPGPRPSCCPSCGDLISPLENEPPPSTQLLEAQARTAELETKVCLLNQKASAAADRWAKYEAELSKLRAQLTSSTSSPLSSSSSQNPNPNPNPSMLQSPTRASFFQTGATRLSALVYPRWSQATPPLPAPATTTTAEHLLEALVREQALRRAAESRLSATSKEVEELSAALFEQANEMVADERRARARLEQRVSELEKRDVEKKRRLDRLELAMDRIERVRNLLRETHDLAPPLPATSLPPG